MSATPPNLSDFRPVVGDAASPGKKKFRVSRSVVIIGVIGIHVVAGTFFALPRVLEVIKKARAQPEGAPVQLMDSEITAKEMVAAKSRKSRLKKPASGDTPAQLAERAGIRIDAPASTLLLVSIGSEGKAGAVEVAESSGNTQLDQVAVSYARAQEWIPPLADEDLGSVPFPVEFAASEKPAPPAG